MEQKDGLAESTAECALWKRIASAMDVQGRQIIGAIQR